MLQVHNLTLPTSSIIELVLFPDIQPLHFIIPSIILDTKGNCIKFNSILTLTTKELLSEIINIKIKHLVLIDSLALIMDDRIYNFDTVKRVFNAIWNCIYETESTFIVVNHYKAEYKNKKIFFKPRFGFYWRKQMSCTVLGEWVNNKIEYRLM
ncbi:hypothetical protein GVAV_003472 [Gurleya vavrai]